METPRPKPDFLANPTESQIGFDATDFGIADGRFEIACANDGDGSSFAWVAGGGEKQYKVTQIDTGYDKDEGCACSVWLLDITNASGDTESAIIDTPNHRLLTTDHTELGFRLVNEVSDALVDLAFELQERHKPVVNLIRPLGRTGRYLLLPRVNSDNLPEEE